jgi:hypothetical protein
MIDAGRENGKEIGEKSGMFSEVKVERSVVNLQIRSLDNDLFEGVVFLILAVVSGNTQASTECSIIASTALSNSS